MRYIFLSLFITGFFCSQGQDNLNNKKKIDFDFFAASNTTNIPYTAILTIGDSNAGMTSSSVTYGPATAAGVAMKWNGTNLTDVALTDFSNVAGVHGTAWKQFAYNYNVSTGSNVVVCNRAVAGSDVSPAADLNDWSTTGNLYVPMVTDANACLTYLNKTKYDAIVVWLGVNDIQAGVSSSTIITYYNSLISRLMISFPSTRIYIVSHSITGTLGMTSSKFTLKKGFRDLAQNNTDVELLCNLDSFNQWGYVDGIHLFQPGYNKIGELLNRSLSSSDTNKEVRQVMNYFDTELSAGHAAAWKTFIEGLQSDNTWIYNAIDCLQVYAQQTRTNVFMDATNIQTPLDGNFDFVLNTYIHTTTAKTIFNNFVPSVCAVNISVTDFSVLVKTGTNLTPAGTQGIVYTSSVGSLWRLFQTSTSVINFNVNDVTNTSYTGDTKIADNTYYSIWRNGTNKRLYKNSTSVQSATVAAGAISADYLEIGGASSEIDCQFSIHIIFKQSVVNMATIQSRCDTLLAALAL